MFTPTLDGYIPQTLVATLLLFRNLPLTPYTLSTNNIITLYSDYVQLFGTLCEQLRTIVRNVIRLFDYSKLRRPSLDTTVTASIPSQTYVDSITATLTLGSDNDRAGASVVNLCGSSRATLAVVSRHVDF